VVSLLATSGLAFDYPGPLRALDGVDFELEPRRLVALCGPNGSGKSTLLKLLAGLLEPAAGVVTVGGRSLHGLSEGERARALARVPQSLPSLPDVTVDNFVLGGRYAHIDRWRGPQSSDGEAVSAALAAADAADLGRRMLGELSGGQMQRVLLARAVAQHTDVLLVDEPTAALDPEHQVRALELLAGLVAEGRGVVVATHDLNLASQFASSVVLLRGGRVVTAGPPGEVLRPAVLRPVYGDNLYYGRMPPPDGRPFVLPWLDPPADPA